MAAKPPSALLFPGQGSQKKNMGKSFYMQSDVARETFNEASDVLHLDMAALCFETENSVLKKTSNAQPALLTVSVAIYRMLVEDHGLTAPYMAGHSLGEYSALTCAGMLLFPDALILVRQRGLLMEQAVQSVSGDMYAILGLEESKLREHCGVITRLGHHVMISASNSPDQHTISGHAAAVQEVVEIAEQIGGKAIPLNVAAPFHCKLMTPIADEFAGLLSETEFQAGHSTVISNVTAQPYVSPSDINIQLKKQLTHPVRWRDTVTWLNNNSVALAWELGPGNVLTRLMNQAPDIVTQSVSEFEDVNKFSVEDTEQVLHFIKRCLAVVASTPNFNRDKEAYEEGVIRPHREIKKMLEQIELGKVAAQVDHLKFAVNRLMSILEVKMLPDKTTDKLIQALINESDMAHNGLL